MIRWAPAAPVVGPAVPADDDIGYWKFYDAVAAAQLIDWMPPARARLLDLSASAGRYAQLAVDAGHDVVFGDVLSLDSLDAGAFDAVVAEGCALSEHLATEFAFERIHELLRPGGELLICVESLGLGLARLAGQERWAELADVPAADVVLVPAEDGTITRCFWPEELHSLLEADGFEVDWIRPRTVLSQQAVNRALATDPAAMPTLVRTELALARERENDSIGIHLVAAARRR